MKRGILLCTAITAIVVGLVVLGMYFWHLHGLSFLSSGEELRGFLEAHRKWAPLLIVMLQCLQVLLAPIPGQAVSVASGYLFGPVMGTLYSMAGLLLGSLLAMGLARKLGRPLVERWVPAGLLTRMDDYARRNGGLFFLAVFLIPLLPDDAICFLAGLSPLPLALLLLIATVGRLPGVAIGAMAGAGIRSLTATQLGVLALVLGLLLITTPLWRTPLQEKAIRILGRLMR